MPPTPQNTSQPGPGNSPPVATPQAPGPLWKSRLRRAWPFIRFAIGLGLAALALSALTSQRGELSGATSYLNRVDWIWAALAVLVEILSLVALAVVQRLLLASGNVRVGLGWITSLTVAVMAITNSLPAGSVIATVFSFRQYRRKGADDALAAWTVVASFIVLGVSLAIIAAVGVGLAGADGASLDLVSVTVVVLVVTLAIGAVFVQKRALVRVVSATVHGCRRLTGWPRGEVADHIDRIISRLTVVSLSPRQMLVVTLWSLASWLLDCLCLSMAFLAVHTPIPWHGLLLAYGAGQLAANLPITPGGLGVVEGSLTIALVAYGGAETSTVAAVLLYRIISFWGELPVGWAAWAWLTWRGRSPFAAMSAALESGSGETGAVEVVG